MRLGKIVTLLLAGFLTFSSLNSLAATKSTKTKSSISTHSTKKQATSKLTQKQAAKTTKQAVKNAKKNAKKVGKMSKVKANKKAHYSHKIAKKRATAQSKSPTTLHSNTAYQHSQTGLASYYGDKFNGHRTASGEVFNNEKLTAAHRTLPFGTLIEVTNLRNGRSVVVKVNDRGPFSHNRILDISSAAAKKLDMLRAGVVNVKIAVVDKNGKTIQSGLYASNE